MYVNNRAVYVKAQRHRFKFKQTLLSDLVIQTVFFPIKRTLNHFLIQLFFIINNESKTARLNYSITEGLSVNNESILKTFISIQDFWF